VTCFYAFPFCAGVSKTIGGLKTNGEHQALDWGGKPLKAPYAIGEIACGLKREGSLLMHCFLAK
jgi:3-oxosteroid 1-dehydrogenase